MQLRSAVLGLATALAVGLAGNAQGLSLANLNAGASFSVGDLTFSDFSITVTGAIDHNLHDYRVKKLSDGFRIVGGFGVFDGQQGDMLVSYQVSVTGGDSVDGMKLAFNGAAAGAHSGATVQEDLFGVPGGDPIASASVFRTAGGLSQKVDSVSFAAQTIFDVEKDILVKAGPVRHSHGKDDDAKDGDKDHDRIEDMLPKGSFATISFVDQRFAVVPEPGTLLLLSGGLMGLLTIGRKRGR